MRASNEFAMAALLDLVLNGEIQPGELLHWLEDSKCTPLSTKVNLPRITKQDFVTFFINYVRSQSTVLQQRSHLPEQQCTRESRNNTKTSPGHLTVKQSGKSRTLECIFTNPELHRTPSSAPRSKTTFPKGATPSHTTKCEEQSRTKPSTQRQHSPNTPYHGHRNRSKHVPKVPTPPSVATNAPDISDSVTFPAVGASPEKSKHIRRITPTPVKHQRWRKLTVNDFLPPEISQENPTGNNANQKASVTAAEREFLRTSPNPIAHKRVPLKASPVNNCPHRRNSVFDVEETSPNHTTHPLCDDGVPDTQVVNYVVPSPDQVTDRDKLDVVVHLFSRFINAGFIANMTIELYFLIQLLTVKVNASTQNEESTHKLLGTVHNAAYFSIAVLEKIFAWLRFLDKLTLKLLSDVECLIRFSEGLKCDLFQLSENTQQVSRMLSSSIQGVPYQTLTDNQENFVSERNFRAFRKQRDMFYDLFRDWQQQQFSETQRNFEDQFQRRVGQILEMCVDPCNYSHLARLVLTQLLTTCCGGLEVDEQGNFSEKFLAELKNKSPDKFEKLEGRLVHPLKVGGPCPSPAFTGCQQFFYDFIKAASRASFLEHLKDQFIARIVELEDEEFYLDTEVRLDSEIKAVFFTTIHTLKLLGLFTGLVEFLPYRSDEKIPAKHCELQRKMRNLKPLPLNIVTMLKASVKKRQLVFTLSWVVNYLSMMDQVATTLERYVEVLSLLYVIYTSEEVRKVTSASFFIRTTLGWLFDLLNLQSFLSASDRGAFIVKPEIAEELIDQQLIHTCCPYLAELRRLLIEHFAGNRGRSGEIRKITPVSARDVELGVRGWSGQLDRQLAENFFHVQPQSVKKTVEFVAERVASNAIKLVKKNVLEMVRSIVACDPECTPEEMDKKTKEITRTLVAQIRDRTEKVASDFCKKQIGEVMHLLLSWDSHKKVVDLCCQLSSRSAILRVLQWADTNVTETFIHHEVSSVLEKKGRCTENRMDASPANAASQKNQDDPESLMLHYEAPSVFESLSELKNLVWEIYSTGLSVSTDESIAVLERCKKSLRFRREHLPASVHCLEQMTFEFVLAVIVRNPRSCSENLLDLASSLWKGSPVVSGLLENICCARNVKLMSTSDDVEESWLKVVGLLLKAAELGVVDVSAIAEVIRAINDFGVSENRLQGLLEQFDLNDN